MVEGTRGKEGRVRNEGEWRWVVCERNDIKSFKKKVGVRGTKRKEPKH